MPTTFLDSSWPQLGGKIAPESNELTDSEQSSFFGPICQLFWLARLISISRAPVLLLERERLYESYKITPGAKHLSRCWAPGRAAQNRNALIFTYAIQIFMIFDNFREMSKFHENLDFSEACPNTSRKRDFSKTHSQTQRMYSWIDLGVSKVGKLLRSQTNSRILRNLHFSDPFTPIFDKHTCMRAVNRQPMFSARGTRRAFSFFSFHGSYLKPRILERQPPNS